MAESFHRVLSYGRLLMGHGWSALVFWVATVYSIYAFFASTEFQKHMLLAVHIDPSYRLPAWGFGLAAVFLYTGFRAWSDSSLRIADLKRDSSLRISTLEQRLRDLAEPLFQAEISALRLEFGSPEGEFGDLVRLWVHMRIRNQGAPSAVTSWEMHVRAPQPGGLSSHTEKGNLQRFDEGDPWGRAGRNLLRDAAAIERGGIREGWLVCQASRAQLGLREGQEPAVMISFKDAYNHDFCAIYPRGWTTDEFHQ